MQVSPAAILHGALRLIIRFKQGIFLVVTSFKILTTISKCIHKNLFFVFLNTLIFYIQFHHPLREREGKER